MGAGIEQYQVMVKTRGRSSGVAGGSAEQSVKAEPSPVPGTLRLTHDFLIDVLFRTSVKNHGVSQEHSSERHQCVLYKVDPGHGTKMNLSNLHISTSAILSEKSKVESGWNAAFYRSPSSLTRDLF